jgi:exodeoxyribonuclease V gamma subunit
MSQTAPRDGDRDSLKSDRYVFLETILSAQKKLIMTWSGFDSGDGSEMPPSVLVEEFKAHLDREYQIAGRKEKAGEAVFVKYPLHPFSARYQSSEMNDVQLQTWNRSWFNPAEKPGDRKPIFQWEFIQKLNADDDTTDGNKIYRTLSDPMKSFLDACRIEVPSKDEIVESVELFEIGGLDEWKLRDAVKREQLCDDPEVIGRLAAGGGIPPGIPGETAVADVKKKVRSQFEKIRSIDDAPKFGFHRVNAEKLGVRYRMDIDLISITDHGSSGKMCTAIIADFGRANAKRKLNLWITHLFLNLDKQTETTLVALDSTVRLKALTQEETVEHICALNKLMNENKQRLLPFIPDVSLAFAEAENIELSRESGWERLEELFGRAFNKEYLLDPRIKEAFEDPENWADAMKKIPGGEDVFKEISNRVFLPFLDTMEEGE